LFLQNEAIGENEGVIVTYEIVYSLDTALKNLQTHTIAITLQRNGGSAVSGEYKLDYVCFGGKNEKPILQTVLEKVMTGGFALKPDTLKID
jgi:hypothetical protein